MSGQILNLLSAANSVGSPLVNLILGILMSRTKFSLMSLISVNKFSFNYFVKGRNMQSSWISQAPHTAVNSEICSVSESQCSRLSCEGGGLALGRDGTLAHLAVAMFKELAFCSQTEVKGDLILLLGWMTLGQVVWVINFQNTSQFQKDEIKMLSYIDNNC